MSGAAAGPAVCIDKTASDAAARTATITRCGRSTPKPGARATQLGEPNYQGPQNGGFYKKYNKNYAYRLLSSHQSCRFRESCGRDLLDGGEQPLAAAAADKGPHLLGLDRVARVAAGQPVRVARRAPDPDEVVERPPFEIGGGVLQVAFFPALGQVALEELDIGEMLRASWLALRVSSSEK